jgi:hypothetical protein
VPDGEHVESSGRRSVVREGTDVTIVALAMMVPRAAGRRRGAGRRAGISAEVIDLRSARAARRDTVLARSRRRARLFTVEENPRLAGWGARSSRSSPTRRSTASTRRWCASPRRTSRCPRRQRSRTWPSRRSSASSRPSAAGWPMPADRLTTVAVLGIGHMGSAMARRLAAARASSWCSTTGPGRATELADELGGRCDVAASPGEAAARRRCAITMVADDGPAPAGRPTTASWPGAQPGSVTVQTSTVLPDTVRELGRAVRRARARVSSTRRCRAARRARRERRAGTIMVGGAADDLERARPVLDALGKRIFELGEVGTGAADQAGRQRHHLRP